MGVLKAIQETSDKALNSGEAYIKVSQEYYRLKAFQQLARAFSFLSKLAVIGGLFFLALIFLTVSTAIWLGELIGSVSLACMLISTGLFLCTLLLYFTRKQIDKIIIRKMSKEFFD
ncbi:hypothetical protein [Aquimarina algicola]|uniref:Phage holin family protein n=1 Tax=Aquimarina algicola TaxID=2589995 RepID=A0A504JCY7_9FLAO|nr:hypothetical protein [Aquimarina algicola]TPN84440.1 hypothetical protein FHK87_16025 [Aquimarina algicola]